MASGFHFVAEQASSVAPQVDLLFDLMTGLSAVIIAGVAGAILYFAVRYRRGSSAPRTGAVDALPIEVAWTLVPLALFIGLFVWSIRLFAKIERPPADVIEDYVVAKQWMWRVQHADGQQEINQLHIPVGRPIRLTMISQDVIHSFYVPAFRVKQDVLPGRYTQLWFTAIRAGDYHLFCSEYCGTDHARMGGEIVAELPADFARWEEQGRPVKGLVAEGASKFRQYGCSGCHSPGSAIHAPSLEGLFGSLVHLSDGTTVIADETYLHDSIVQPGRQVVAGYQPQMPSFAGQLNESDILALTAYIRSRGPRGHQR